MIQVDIEDIEYLRGLRLSWVKIARYLGISRSTLYRRLEEEGLSHYTKYTDINDSDLDSIIAAIKQNHPNDGECLMTGHLAREGIIIPRAKLRASIHRVDPINTALRRSFVVRRRVYSVPGPNAVWHIDGHHKLIRWRFVTHGGIDGYSRTIVYLKCHDNNRADTVLSAFQDAVYDYGLPSRIRSDLGGENVDVWRYMIEQLSDMSAVITGCSTHNERIERLWRDVYRSVGILFREVFFKLEDDELLNPLNEVDMFCLHLIFLPRINAALESFTESWNNHSISTRGTGNLTPNQLFIKGALEQNITPVIPSSSSGEFEGEQPTQRDHVHVPRSTFLPCILLKHQLDAIDYSGLDYFDTTAYLQVSSTVGQHLSSGCYNCSDH